MPAAIAAATSLTTLSVTAVTAAELGCVQKPAKLHYLLLNKKEILDQS